MNFTDFKDKALQNLAVAEWCQENGHYDACCNRAYYAMYHAAIAALADRHITPSQTHIDHGWVQTQFVIHFCNRNKNFSEIQNIFAGCPEDKGYGRLQTRTVKSEEGRTAARPGTGICPGDITEVTEP